MLVVRQVGTFSNYIYHTIGVKIAEPYLLQGRGPGGGSRHSSSGVQLRCGPVSSVAPTTTTTQPRKAVTRGPSTLPQHCFPQVAGGGHRDRNVYIESCNLMYLHVCTGENAVSATLDYEGPGLGHFYAINRLNNVSNLHTEINLRS